MKQGLVAKLFFLNIFFISTLLFCQNNSVKEIFIRINQLGYLPEDLKSGMVFSENQLPLSTINIRRVEDTSLVFVAELKFKTPSRAESKFKYIAEFDFTSLIIPGEYFAEISSFESHFFFISDKIYNGLTEKTLFFFSSQRCGPTSPLLHKKCHLSDVNKIEGEPDSIIADLTGGWHDAGDYIKFLSTTAFTTYLLIFSYEFDKEKYGFDIDKNGVADVLDEAKIGLDWLLRCNYTGNKLITQVQDTSDHTTEWRLPENDLLQFNRAGYSGLGKNIVGIYTAALSMAARIWKSDIGDEEFSDKCISTALKFYNMKDTIPDIDSSGSEFYKDIHYEGKLALGAIELYETTGEQRFLEDAEFLCDSAGADFWWSYGNMNSIAHYKVAKYDIQKINYLKESLQYYSKNMKLNDFDEPLEYSWGTTHSFLGTAITEILYHSLTGDISFRHISALSRDFVLGRNRWGVSFINGFGENYSKNIHSQIAHFNHGVLPGAMVGGPAPLKIQQQFVDYTDQYTYFNDDIHYSDNRMNFITNEAAIISNAAAFFVMGYHSDIKK